MVVPLNEMNVMTMNMLQPSIAEGAELDGAEPANGAAHLTGTVGIIDTQSVWRAGMAQLVSALTTLRVVSAVSSVEELDVGSGLPDLVVLDLPLRRGRVCLDPVISLARQCLVLVTSAPENVSSLLEALRMGARGCVTRQSTERVIVTALAAILSGGLYICPDVAAGVHLDLRRDLPNDSAGLAPREIETLCWIARGYTYTQIASRMGLTESTVNTYTKRIRAKLNVRNKAQLTRMAIELGHLDDRRDHPAA
jgi:DNA-binding NarL/FixJ family response regulator